MKRLAALAALVVTIMLGGPAAVAAPLAVPAAKAVAPVEAPITLARHARRPNYARCALGRAGWHRHTRGGARIACRPRAPGAGWTWRCQRGVCGWWHVQRRHYHHIVAPGHYIRVR